MDCRIAILKGLRKGYRTITRSFFYPQNYSIDRSYANQEIANLLSSTEPCMVSRLGSVEMGVIMNYLSVHDKNRFRSYARYLLSDYGLPVWDPLFFKSMKRNMGLFPENVSILEQFSKLMLEYIPEIDLLGSMHYSEKFLNLSHQCKKVHIECLYPFFCETPWTKVLEGKRVLVVHPFVSSILSQYQRRDYLFENKDILPQFNLITYEAILSNAGAIVPYQDWFEALEKMESDISKISFDIAILGCGAYGLPLAAFIKRMGKKAIHIGGGTQLLFGIKGRRWESDYYYPYLPKQFTDYKPLFNEYWIRPSIEETPKGSNTVEDACYW